jgi:hypothetical protein
VYTDFIVLYLISMALSLVVHLCTYDSLEEAVKEVNEEDQVSIELNAWICLSTAFAPLFLIYVLYFYLRKPQ